MFKIFAVELKNFKCYYGDHSFEFPQGGGLYYLTGRNNFNSRLGANACGKTSLIDAIEWAIYGKTSRGLRAGDIVSWGKKTASVSVSLLVGEDEVEITRTQSPNAIAINGKPSSQDEVNKQVRLSQEAFNCSIILPQFGESFFDRSPTEKLSLFSQVMDLDYWLDKSKAADDAAGRVANKIAIAENTISKAEGKLEHTRSSIKELDEKSASFAQSVKDDVAALKDEIKRAERTSEKAWVELKKKTRLLKKSNADLAEVKEALEEAAVEFESVEKKFMDYMAEIKANERDVKNIEAELGDMEDSKGTVCPSCKQRIDDKHVEDRQDKLRKLLKELDTSSSKLSKRIVKMEDKRAGARKDARELGNLRISLEKDNAGISHEIKSIEHRIKQAVEDIDAYNARIRKLEGKTNPFEEMIAKLKRQRSDLKTEIKDLRKDLEKYHTQHEAYSYWVGGFKRVRLYVIEEALTSLEIEVNNLLISLGLVDWKIKFDIERENKSGSVTKGFSVFIHSPKHDKPVRFESWSGGETQRLRLAGDLGLANLIMEQAGFVSQIEIIDEPSEHMSPEGIEDMTETLYQRAHNIGRQIWLVDHSTMEFADFSGVLTAEMNNKGHATLTYE